VGLGAAVLGPDPRGAAAGVAVDEVATIRPDPLAIRRDLPVTYRNGCHLVDNPARACVLGDANAAYTVAVVGDSHAAQWLPALEAIAVTSRWRLISYSRAGCAFMDTQRELPGVDEPCMSWNARLRPQLTGPGRPNLVLMSSASREPAGFRAEFVTAIRRAWSEVAAAGVTVVALRDTPWPGIDIAECLSEHRHRLTRCAVARGEAVTRAAQAWSSVQDEALAGLKKVRLVDLTDAICPNDPCAAVIGGVVVYRDAHHLTATYAATLAPRLRDEIERALD
jgi:hypothetical protein